MFELFDKEGKKVIVKTCTDKKEYLASGYYFEKKVNPSNKKEGKDLPEEPVVKVKPKKRKGF